MKRARLLLPAFALALSAATLAATPPAKSPEPKSGPKAKTDAEIAPFKVSPGRPKNVAELAAHFQEIDKNLQSLSARFAQSLTMPDAGLSQRVEGTLEYLKPDRFHLEHYKPERQTVVCDGSKIWIYRADRNQAIGSLLADWKKSDPFINDLLDLGSYSKLLAAYDVSYDSHTLQVVLRPREKTGEPFVLKLKLSGPYLFPMETELDAAQTTIRSSLSDVRFNPKIQASRFRFAPPPGAEVLDRFKPPVRGQPSP